MTDREILVKAMTEAVKNGFGWIDFFSAQGLLHYKGLIEEIAEQLVRNKTWGILIFNHKFAQALWGFIGDDKTNINNWHYHLQKMVVAEKPLKYLGDHI